ncbi:MAG: hypothetical protein H6587_12390 [Flavobacteriales bacterium]|nr:hypothetical protein [Flavobacteriales bacterium]
MRLVIIVLMVGLTSFCYGQENESKKDVGKESIEKADELKKMLDLSGEQYEKVKLIYVRYLKEKNELNTKIKELEKRKKAIKIDRNSMIISVLTPDQKKELERQKNKKKRSKKD